MEINVVKIEEQDGKYPKKILFTDRGEKINVNKSNKCYDYVVAPGPYSLEWGEWQGKKFVKTLKFNGDYSLQYKKPQQGAISSDKTASYDDKQRDIKLEFYAGIAKDIFVSRNKHFTAKDVMCMAKDLMLMHNDIIVMDKDKTLAGLGKDFYSEVNEVFPDSAYIGQEVHSEPEDGTEVF